MDRRQRKTREAIFDAFSALLAERRFTEITVQEVIAKADIGRSTFYMHFQTKDELLRAMCDTLFEHVFTPGSAKLCMHEGFTEGNSLECTLCHILHHLKANHNRLAVLLSEEGGEHFQRAFRDHLEELIAQRTLDRHMLNGRFNPCPHCQQPRTASEVPVPRALLLRTLSATFLELIRWWLRDLLQTPPAQLAQWYMDLLPPSIHSVE